MTMTQKIDSYHHHEVMDRSYLAAEFFAQHLQEHPAVEADPQLKAAAEKVLDALVDFYQLAATKTTGKPKRKRRKTI
jgi:hypothetical protein